MILFLVLSCENKNKPAPVKKVVVQKTQEEIEYEKKVATVRAERLIVQPDLDHVKKRRKEMRSTFENLKREDLSDNSSYDKTRIQFMCTVRRCLGKDKVKYIYPGGSTVNKFAVELYSIKKDGSDIRKVLSQDELFQFGWMLVGEPIARSNDGRYLAFRVSHVQKEPKNKLRGITPYFKELKKRIGKHFDKNNDEILNDNRNENNSES